MPFWKLTERRWISLFIDVFLSYQKDRIERKIDMKDIYLLSIIYPFSRAGIYLLSDLTNPKEKSICVATPLGRVSVCGLSQLGSCPLH